MLSSRQRPPVLPLYLALVITGGMSVLVFLVRATPWHTMAGENPWVFEVGRGIGRS